MSPSNPCLTGVLLAAGSGSRLGMGPKALLRKGDGATLLESALQALLEGGCTDVVVVLGADATRIKSGMGQLHSTTVLVNAAWETGMGSSFARGMVAVPQGSTAMVTLVDQPGLSAEVVQRIVLAHRRGRITAAGYRTANASLRRGHPVLFAPGHIRRAAAAASGDAGARAYLAAHRELVDLVDCSDLDSGLDVDTVEDLHLLDGN